MRVFVNRWFQRFARRERINDQTLRDAVARAERGLIDADLGGGLLKQQVARENQGRAGGYRAILLFQQGDRAIFIYGFAKNDQENIEPGELQALRKLAETLASLTNDQLETATRTGTLSEIDDEQNL